MYVLRFLQIACILPVELERLHNSLFAIDSSIMDSVATVATLYNVVCNRV